MLNICKTCGEARRDNAPVFCFGWEGMREGWTWTKAAGDPLVCITERRPDEMSGQMRRTCLGLYNPAKDAYGVLAVQCGARYYNEGMALLSTDAHEERVACFQAAELLFIVASHKGYQYAGLYFGYLYERDLCDGRYWKHWDRLVFTDGALRRYESDATPRTPIEERAYWYYSNETRFNSPEALYKLGDMYQKGMGCEQNLSQALDLYFKAYDLAVDRGMSVDQARAARRIATAYEEGMGCDQSFEQALAWYELSIDGVENDVEAARLAGEESWYGPSLKRGQDGLKRVRQELGLE